MKIYGAGMAGLLAGHMLRRFDPVIYEAQKSLPNNHAALLRFRTDAVSRATNIPFKKVRVQKLIAHAGKLYDKPNLKLSNMYAQKVTGKITDRSINNLDPVDRYIAPDNFISILAKGCDIRYNAGIGAESLQEQLEKDEPIISTIPMNIMMDIAGWLEKPLFEYQSIWSVVGNIKKPQSDVYQTIYYPDFHENFYRVSLTGNTFIMEYIEEPEGGIGDDSPALKDAHAVLAREFGIHSVEFDGPLLIKEQKIGKLLPIDPQARKEFILWLTDKYKIYSLGRFATWRQILLDEVVNDVSIIERMVEQRDSYSRRLVDVNGYKGKGE